MSRDTLQPHISTPIPAKNVKFENRDGEDVAVIKISPSISIILLKDSVDGTLLKEHAMTRVIDRGGFNIKWNTYNDGSFRFKSITYEIYIQTFYNNLDDRKNTSGYGRGTTKKDKKGGNTTLRFHEGKHGELIIRTIRKSRFRSVTKNVRKQRYGSADELFSVVNQNFRRYMDKIGRENELKIDCIGTRPPKSSHIHCPEPPQPKSEPSRRRRQRIE